MNPHIELVKKWLADPESVSLEELKDADVAARDNYRDAVWNDYRDAARGDAEGAAAVYRASTWASDAADAAKVADVDHCKQKAIEAVREYEELIK
jgi:hypothetical protein